MGLLEPQGGFRLLPYFPPFFPLLLAAFGAIGIDGVRASLLINVFAMGGNSLVSRIGVLSSTAILDFGFVT